MIKPTLSGLALFENVLSLTGFKTTNNVASSNYIFNCISIVNHASISLDGGGHE